MTIDALLELKRSREADIAFVRDNHKDFERWRGELNQVEVSRALGIPNAYIGKFEAGNVNGMGEECIRKLVDLYRKLKEMSDAS